MTQRSAAESQAILGAYDFSTAKVVVDVGGGQGSLLASILVANPQARGVLFDQPEVVEDSRPIDQAGVRERCEVVGGDFFKAVPSGDMFLLKMVLHDWDDDACLDILSCCRTAIAGRSAARLLVIEAVLPEDCSPHPGFFMDINMMVLNHGGRERTHSEFAALLDKAGFLLRRTVPTLGPTSILEAVPV